MLRIQWKVTLMVLLILVTAIGAVIWKTQSLIVEDKISFITDASIKQTAPLKRLVQDRLSEQRKDLVRFAASRATPGAQVQALAGFDVVALIQPTENSQWSPTWVERNPALLQAAQASGQSASQERWPAGFELTLLKSLPYAKTKDGESYWVRLSDMQGSPVYAVMIPVEVASNVSSPPSTSMTGGDAAQATDLQGKLNAEAAQLPDAVNPVGNTVASAKRGVVVGFASSNPLTTVTEDFIGSTNTVYIIDDKGYVASHVNKAYLGALFSEDPLVQDLLKNERPAYSGNFEDLESRPVIGHYEKIDKTNLYAVITTPMLAVTQAAEGHLRVALATACAVGLIGLLLAWLMGRNLSAPLQGAIDAIEAINRGDSATVVAAKSNDEVGVLTRLLAESSPAALIAKTDLIQAVQSAEASRGESRGPLARSEAQNDTRTGLANLTSDRLADERRAAFEAFNEGFTATVKDPIMAILGHAQLVKAKSSESEVQNHADSIEREARRAKDVIERLSGFGAADDVLDEDEPVNLLEVIDHVLAKAANDLESEGVEIVRETAPVPKVHGSSVDLASALTHLLDNAREAVRFRSTKQIRVQLEFLNDRVFLQISDSGVGMSRDVKERAFEPFFKGFESTKRMGLGLAFVQASLRRHHGEYEIDSTPGEGTTMTLKFPVGAEEKRLFQQESVRKLASDVENLFKHETPTPVLPLESSSELSSDLKRDSVADFMTPPPLEKPNVQIDLDAVTATDASSDSEEFAPGSEFGFAPISAPINSASQSGLLGGKKPLSPEQSTSLPQPPDDHLTDEKALGSQPVGATVKRPATPPPSPAARSIVADLTASAKASASIFDDDDDDQFSNMSISQAMRPPSTPPPSAQIDTSSAGGDGQSGFQVRIRKPKSKS